MNTNISPSQFIAVHSILSVGASIESILVGCEQCRVLSAWSATITVQAHSFLVILPSFIYISMDLCWKPLLLSEFSTKYMKMNCTFLCAFSFLKKKVIVDFRRVSGWMTEYVPTVYSYNLMYRWHMHSWVWDCIRIVECCVLQSVSYNEWVEEKQQNVYWHYVCKAVPIATTWSAMSHSPSLLVFSLFSQMNFHFTNSNSHNPMHIAMQSTGLLFWFQPNDILFHV